MPDKPYEDVEIEGHLIDSLTMPQTMDEIMDLEGEYEVLTFDVGRVKDDPSHAVLRIFGRDAAHLDELLTAVTKFGMVAVQPHDAVLEAADMHGVFPDAFYSTTNLDTFVRVAGDWVRVQHPEMDCGIRVYEAAGTAETVVMSDVQAGDRFVTGHRGIRVLPLERPRESQPFEFMASAVSSEKPKAQIVNEIARVLRQAKREGRLAIVVAGPAVVHTDATVHLRMLHPDPITRHAHEGVEVGGGVEGVGEDAVDVGSLEYGIVRLHRAHAELRDGPEQLVQVSGVAAEDAKHGVRRVILHAPDVEGQYLVLALEVHDLVHRLRHRQRVDEVALDLDVFVGLVGHQILRGS